MPSSNRVFVDNFAEHFNPGQTVGKLLIANSSGVVTDVIQLDSGINAVATIQYGSDGEAVTPFDGEIEGFVADAEAADGNPVPGGGIYNSTLPTYTNGQRVQNQYGSRGSQNVQVLGVDGTTGMNVSNSGIDGFGTGSGSALAKALLYIFNGSTWDRARGDATNGLLTYQTALSTLFDADGDNTAQVLKASAGVLYFLEVYNANSADAWIQFFDVAAGSVNVGTTTPKLSLYVPPGANDKVWVRGINFATAITYACTTTQTGNGDPTTGLTVNAGYI